MPYSNEAKIVDETEGIKHYCTCGESSNKPYCDGAHERMNTGKLPVEAIIGEDQRVAVCDCGKTGKPPFCDGSHMDN